MRRRSPRRRGILRLTTAFVLGPIALTAAGIVASPQTLSDMLGLDASAASNLLVVHAQLRNLLEFLIVLMQVGAVAALCLWRLVPSDRCGTIGRRGFVVALVGLGVGGTLCAGYCSPFALYSGFTMAFLLVMSLMGSETAAVNPFRPSYVPVMIGK